MGVRRREERDDEEIDMRLTATERTFLSSEGCRRLRCAYMLRHEKMPPSFDRDEFPTVEAYIETLRS